MHKSNVRIKIGPPRRQRPDEDKNWQIFGKNVRIKIADFGHFQIRHLLGSLLPFVLLGSKFLTACDVAYIYFCLEEKLLSPREKKQLRSAAQHEASCQLLCVTTATVTAPCTAHARAVRMASPHKQRAKLNLALAPFPSTLNSLPLSLV